MKTARTADEATMRKLIAFFATDLLGPADNHSDRIFIGNESAGAWIVTAGLSPPEQLIKFIDALPVLKKFSRKDAKKQRE